MGRWLGSAQNKVCKWDVFKVVIQTQIQDITQTNWIMGLKCVHTNEKKSTDMFQHQKIWKNSSTLRKTTIHEQKNTPKSLKIELEHTKSLAVTRFWSRLAFDARSGTRYYLWPDSGHEHVYLRIAVEI